MTIREIVEKYLLDNKCDGLVLGSLKCSCGNVAKNLMWCGSPEMDCKAAYRHLCDRCSDDMKRECGNYVAQWTVGCYKTEVQR